MRVVRGGPEVSEASLLTLRLIVEGVPDDEIVDRLGTIPAKTLSKAARLLHGHDGFPAGRGRALLLAAANGSPAPSVPDSQRLQEEEQTALIQGDLEQSFALLAQRLPALLDLERLARDGVPSSQWPRHVRLLQAQGGDPALGTMFVLLKQARMMVGPKAHQPDPLLASPAAESVVRRHLANVAGVEPPADNTDT